MRESLSQWEMTNAICPEHSACVNPRRVPAGPHPTPRPLCPPTQHHPTYPHPFRAGGSCARGLVPPRWKHRDASPLNIWGRPEEPFHACAVHCRHLFQDFSVLDRQPVQRPPAGALDSRPERRPRSRSAWPTDAGSDATSLLFTNCRFNVIYF